MIPTPQPSRTHTSDWQSILANAPYKTLFAAGKWSAVTMQCAPCRSQTLQAATSSPPCRGYQYPKVNRKSLDISISIIYFLRPRFHHGVLDILATELGGVEACAGADQRGEGQSGGLARAAGGEQMRRGVRQAPGVHQDRWGARGETISWVRKGENGYIYLFCRKCGK